jgi:hypothetical protein
MPVENRGGDVGSEIGEPKKLAEVGSVQLLPLRQIAELAAAGQNYGVPKDRGSMQLGEMRPARRGPRESAGTAGFDPIVVCEQVASTLPYTTPFSLLRL